MGFIAEAVAAEQVPYGVLSSGARSALLDGTGNLPSENAGDLPECDNVVAYIQLINLSVLILNHIRYNTHVPVSLSTAIFVGSQPVS